MSLSQQHLSSASELREPARKWNSQAQHAARTASRRNLFLDLPIAWRLTLGFLVAALVAALAAGVVGIQRSASLSRQTDFYHNLLQLNTSLTNGRSFLELMNSKTQQTLSDATAPDPSRETLSADNGALSNLAKLYGLVLSSYAQDGLLAQHPDQQALLDEAGDDGLIAQQQVLLNSAQRTWQVYQEAQQEFLNDISSSNPKAAQDELQQQEQPTNSDALSALQALIRLNDHLASAVDDAANVEVHNQLLTTLIATICAFMTIALVGWFISETLVRRLRHLHRVTRSIEEGHTSERVLVAGRDEIAEVSLAVNAMVDTIVALLEETRQQRDALAGAAEHLFSDMRIVNAGDLRVSAPVSDDPIGMLANAFNFTVGRFRRFVLRTQTTIEQLEVVARQGQERSNSFISLVRAQLRDVPTSTPAKSAHISATGSLQAGKRRSTLQTSMQDADNSLIRQAQLTQDTLLQFTREDLNKRLGVSRETLEKASRSVGRLSELISTRSGASFGNVTEKMVQAQLQEVVALEQFLNRLAWELRQTQFNSANNLTKLDATFADLARLVSERLDTTVSNFSETAPSVSEAEYQELLRQAGSFAVEANALSRRLTAIIQEIRTAVTPFRLDSTASMGEPLKTPSASLSAEQAFAASASGNLLSTW